MAFHQGGADMNPKPPKTKAELKRAVAADPKKVYLYSTSAFGNQFSGLASELPLGDEFNVVGPDPYKQRNWYATVKYNKKGVLVVT